MSLELISIRELLRDPQYRAYFTKAPTLPSHYGPERKPWKLIVLKQGESVWRSKRFGTYQEAFKGFKQMLPTITNAAINCPPLGFMPPIRNFKIKGQTDGRGKPIIRSRVWTPKITDDMEQHYWCPYCRRPSVFRMAVLARKGSSDFATTIEPAIRCMICGAADTLVNLRRPELAQSWDANRPKVYTR